MRVTRIVALFCLLPPILLPARQPAVVTVPRGLQLNDWHRDTTLGGPAMSPDGKHFTRKSVGGDSRGGFITARVETKTTRITAAETELGVR